MLCLIPLCCSESLVTRGAQGNTCGNSCEIPDRATCDDIIAMLLMDSKRFHELNPSLDCSHAVPAGTSVCMGGTCGD